MTTLMTTNAKDLDAEALKVLAGRNGPCISIVLPDHHPGASEGSRRTIFRSLLKQASEQLPAGQWRDLLGELEPICDDSALDAGGLGWAIFRSPDFLGCYRVSAKAERLSIASHFLLAPFVTAALVPAEMFVLGLSTKHLRLFECSQHTCRELALPEGVPPSVEAAGQFDRGERTLENRSTAGSSTGDMRSVRFGTATDRDTSGAYLHDFFEIVDRELKPLVGRKPLVLMGVREEIAAYRRTAGTGNPVLAGEPGNIEFLSPAEIGARAREVVLKEYYKRGEEVLAELREIPDRRRVATEIREVLRAAAQGRVHRLCVRAETELIAPLESTANRLHAEGEDLVNAAVVESLRTSGEVFTLPQDRLPAIQPLAAILRY